MSTTSGSPAVSRETTPTNSPNQVNDGATSSSTVEQIVEEEPLPEILKISKSKGADVLSTYYQENPEGMYFSDFKEAVAAIKHAQWQPPANDTTIPRNNEQDKVIVRRLVVAFLDLESAMDTEGNAYRKRFTPGTTVFYNPWTIERCAWEILRMVKAMHLDGFMAPIFDADILKCIGQTEQWTFEERISMICRVVKISKSVAVSLMKHEKVWTTIGAPHKLYNSTLVNTQSNAYRNKWVKAGREADKANGEQPAVKRKRSSVSATSRKSSATVVPSPLVNTFPSQSTSSQAASAMPSNHVSDAATTPTSATPTSTSTTQAKIFAAQAAPLHVPRARPSKNAGNGHGQLSYTHAPPSIPIPLPQSASHSAHTVPGSIGISAIDALRSSMRTPMATTFTPQSNSPYAVPAPLGSKISNVKLRAASMPAFAPHPRPAPAPASAISQGPAQTPTAHRPSTAQLAPIDTDVEMTDAARAQPMGADKKMDMYGREDELNGKVAAQIPRPSFVETTNMVPDPVPADTVTTLSTATAPASNARSPAEFDAAEMLLGLRKTEG